MPEEVNRVVTDQVADLLLTHSPEAAAHLAREGIAAERIVFVGNVMIDSLFASIAASSADAAVGFDSGSARRLRTGHVASTVERGFTATSLEACCSGLESWRSRCRCSGRCIRGHALGWKGCDCRASLLLVEPAAYREMTHLLDGCAVVITDSGGLQEESTALGVPCVTLRETTERPITVTGRTNRLVPWPPTAAGNRCNGWPPHSRPSTASVPRFPVGTDTPAERVVDALENAPRGAGRCAPAADDALVA